MLFGPIDFDESRSKIVSFPSKSIKDKTAIASEFLPVKYSVGNL